MNPPGPEQRRCEQNAGQKPPSAERERVLSERGEGHGRARARRQAEQRPQGRPPPAPPTQPKVHRPDEQKSRAHGRENEEPIEVFNTLHKSSPLRQAPNRRSARHTHHLTRSV